jgi:hypothetical protein
MSDTAILPEWPVGTVAILATAGQAPHAIPVSALVRAGPRLALIALARGRESLARLRADPAVTLAICAAGVAVSVDGFARVVAEDLTEGVAAVAVDVEAVRDHGRPTFAVESGVAWRWTDADASARDAAVHEALRALARQVRSGSGDGVRE